MPNESVASSWVSVGGAPTAEDMKNLSNRWLSLLAMGIIYVLLGILALLMPMVSSLGLTLSISSLLIVGGVVHLFHAVQLRHHHGGALRFLQPVLALVAGALMLRYPAMGLQGLTLVFSFYFFAGAISEWILASALRPHKGWGWGIASSIINFFLGVYVIATLPFSALWVPGALLGINLFMVGCAMIGVSWAVKNGGAQALRVPSSSASSSTVSR